MGVDYCQLVSSGTSALTTALASAGVGAGDEVIMPSFTFVASFESILALGAIPVLVDVDENNGPSLAKDLGTYAKFIACDISKEKEVKLLFKTILDEYKSIDVVVNNAGIISDNVIWKMPVEDFEKVIDE